MELQITRMVIDEGLIPMSIDSSHLVVNKITHYVHGEEAEKGEVQAIEIKEPWVVIRCEKGQYIHHINRIIRVEKDNFL